MEKSYVFLIASIFLVGFFFMSEVSAAENTCSLSVEMINQDPYPAIPGDYVKVLFQIDGIQNTQCGNVQFGVKEEYPFSLDPNVQNPITIQAGTYQREYSSFYLAPYRVRIDENALDGDNPIEVYYSTSTGGQILKKFDVNVKDVRADFEIYVKEYDHATDTITFEILNTAKADIEGLTLEIPKQETVMVKGSNINIVGSLDSNEYTTADFKLEPMEGMIKILVHYTDSTNTRRTLEKEISYDPAYFPEVNQGTSMGTILFWLVVLGIIGYIVYRKFFKKKREHHQHHAAKK